MSYPERLAQLLYWLLWFGVAAVVIVVSRAAITGHRPFETAVDKDTGTAALLVATDAATGCQYILTPWGGIAPRTGRDGRQLCSPPSAAPPGQPAK